MLHCGYIGSLPTPPRSLGSPNCCFFVVVFVFVLIILFIYLFYFNLFIITIFWLIFLNSFTLC